MTRTLLLTCMLGALLGGCPEFPRDALHYDGGGPCRDEDNDRYPTCEGDCDDTSRDVHPDQDSYFTSPYRGSFDYNCDRKEEPELTDTASCVIDGETCVGSGWAQDQPVPGCGETGSFIECQKLPSNKCNERPAERTQACR